jgi:hypothetical protein
MAKLPYTITICPDEPNPKQFTAMNSQLINAMRFGYDMTINQNQYIWPAGSQGATQINTHKEKEMEIDDSNLAECEYCGYVEDWNEIPTANDPWCSDGTVTVCPECNEGESFRDYQPEKKNES